MPGCRVVPPRRTLVRLEQTMCAPARAGRVLWDLFLVWVCLVMMVMLMLRRGAIEYEMHGCDTSQSCTVLTEDVRDACDAIGIDDNTGRGKIVTSPLCFDVDFFFLDSDGDDTGFISRSRRSASLSSHVALASMKRSLPSRMRVSAGPTTRFDLWCVRDQMCSVGVNNVFESTETDGHPPPPQSIETPPNTHTQTTNPSTTPRPAVTARYNQEDTYVIEASSYTAMKTTACHMWKSRQRGHTRVQRSAWQSIHVIICTRRADGMLKGTFLTMKRSFESRVLVSAHPLGQYHLHPRSTARHCQTETCCSRHSSLSPLCCHAVTHTQTFEHASSGPYALTRASVKSWTQGGTLGYPWR